jgi:hypothetical protein
MEISKAFRLVVTFTERAIGYVIFAVGVRTIIDYLERTYPKTYTTASTFLLMGILVWFFIKYLAIPFFEGMRGTKNIE